MRKILLSTLVCIVMLASCTPAGNLGEVPPSVLPSPTPVSHSLTIFAAASLTNAFTELGHHFEATHPGVTVTFNFAGSQILSAQLIQGATADVFASANHAEMDKLVADHLILPAAIQDFLTNQLIVILPPENPANVHGLQDLAHPGLKLVLADAAVPAGKYARQVLDNISQDPAYGSDFSTRVLVNVVSNETDVRQVVAKVQLGEADAGIVYLSDAVAVPQLKTIEIPLTFNAIARYPIAPLADSPNHVLAAEFIAFVLSPDGQGILQKWGFTPIIL